jgi:hypothetical protein
MVSTAVSSGRVVALDPRRQESALQGGEQRDGGVAGVDAGG